MSTMTETYDEIVEELKTDVIRGAALLDERMPDWFTRIDTQDLIMQSCLSCMLGQLFTDYDIGVHMLFPDAPHVRGRFHGFTLREELWQAVYADDPAETVRWDYVQRDLWIEQITIRRDRQ